MPFYKNVGKAPWRRPVGGLVAPGAVFEATDREHARIVRRGYRGRLLLLEQESSAPSAVEAPVTVTDVSSPAETVVVEAEVQEASAPVAPPPDDAEWTLRMTPGTYLRLHPDGPNAPLARRILGEEG